MAGARQHRSECPIASALDIVGDKWTLLVLRDLLDGRSRFGEFEKSPEGIPTNILTDRLRRLATEGLVKRQRAGSSKRFEYRVTPKGEALRPAILALAAWGNTFVPDTWVPPHDYLQASTV